MFCWFTRRVTSVTWIKCFHTAHEETLNGLITTSVTMMWCYGLHTHQILEIFWPCVRQTRPSASSQHQMRGYLLEEGRSGAVNLFWRLMVAQHQGTLWCFFPQSVSRLYIRTVQMYGNCIKSIELQWTELLVPLNKTSVTNSQFFNSSILNWFILTKARHNLLRSNDTFT